MAIIRQYLPTDRSAMVDIFQRNVPTFFVTEEQSDFEDYLDKFADTYFVGEHYGRVVGGGGYYLKAGDTVGGLSWVLLDPAYQRVGLGHQLMSHCLGLIRQYPAVQKITVSTSQHVHEFFAKLGFMTTRIAANHCANGLDLYAMEIDLTMQVLPSEMADLDLIFTFYDLATAFQKTVSAKHWLGFDRQMVEQEIRENRQWKLMQAGKVAGIFATTFNDVQFWGEKDQQPSIYIHRIVTHPDFRGRSLVCGIIHWAKQFAVENDKQFIRMDTWGDNDKLIAYYQRLGFAYIDTIDLDQTVGLPKHYTGPLALFEIAVN